MDSSELTATTSTHDLISPWGRGLPEVESRGQRGIRQGKLARVYAWVWLLVAMLVVLVALVGTNTRAVKLGRVVGSTDASLIWIILGAAVIGWLLGMATSVVSAQCTRRQV